MANWRREPWSQDTDMGMQFCLEGQVIPCMHGKWLNPQLTTDTNPFQGEQMGTRRTFNKEMLICFFKIDENMSQVTPSRSTALSLLKLTQTGTSCSICSLLCVQCYYFTDNITSLDSALQHGWGLSTKLTWSLSADVGKHKCKSMHHKKLKTVEDYNHGHSLPDKFFSRNPCQAKF